MAIVKIQHRRGSYTDYDPSKVLPGELVVTQSNDPNSSDGQAVYIATTAGNVKQLATMDDMQSEVETVVNESISEVTDKVDEYKTEIEETGQEVLESIPADYTQLSNDVDDLKSDLEQKGLSEDAKVALLNCFAHVAWIDEHGQDYYDALDDALYPLTNLVRITAEFTQGSAVIYATTPLNDLKAYLVVTGYYDNGRSAQITDYTLSGTLTVGTSTITVSASEKTTTFNVVVSPPYWDYEWSATSGELPQDMVLATGAEYDFTTEQGALYLRKGATLDFDYIGNCELIVELKCATYHGGSASPSIRVARTAIDDKYKSAVFTANRGEGNALMSVAVSETWIDTTANSDQWHKYKIEANNSGFNATIDDISVGSGDGKLVTSSVTGMTLATYEVCYLKSIKFRRIQ